MLLPLFAFRLLLLVVVLRVTFPLVVPRFEEEPDLTVVLPLLRLPDELLRVLFPALLLLLEEELDLTVALFVLRLVVELDLTLVLLPLLVLRLVVELDLTVVLPLLRLDELALLLFTALRLLLLVLPRVTLPLVAPRLLLDRVVLTALRLPLVVRLAVASGRYTLTALLSTTVLLPEFDRRLLLSTLCTVAFLPVVCLYSVGVGPL